MKPHLVQQRHLIELSVAIDAANAFGDVNDMLKYT